MIIVKELLLQLLFALLPFILFNIHYRDKTENYSQKFIMFSCMLSLFLAMTFSLSPREGYIFDARHIIMFFGIVFGGWQTGCILLIEFVLYRFYMGGEGQWYGTLILVVTFLVSILFRKLYHQANKKWVVTTIAGFIFSIHPALLLFIYESEYVLKNLTFHILAIPIFYFIGIWLLVSLFKKAVSDKEVFIRYTQNEKFEAISHVAASFAHEVRNPLTVVKGFLKFMRECPDQNKMNHYIDISLSELERTESLLSEYLALAKPHSKRKERTDLTRTIQVIMDVMKPYATLRNVQTQLDIPVSPIWIFANEDEMKQTLINFVKNAIEACDEVPHASVSLKVKLEDKNVILVIEDNGVGMTEDQINRLGSIYFSTKSNGTGLGLTYSYQVIRILGGNVSVRSQKKVGTTFTISVPFHEVS